MMPGFLMPNFLPAAPLFGIDPILSMYLGNPMFFPNSDEDSDFAPSEADHHWLDEEQEDFDEEDMEEDDDIFGGEHLPWHCPCPMHHLQRLTRAANERRQNPTFIDLVGDDEIEEIYPINSRNASQSNHNNEIIDLTLGDDDHDVSIVPPAEINNRQVEGEALTTVESRKRRRRDV